MKISKIGMFLLSIFLISWGLITLIPGLNGLSWVPALFAIAAAIFILVDRRTMPLIDLQNKPQ